MSRITRIDAEQQVPLVGGPMSRSNTTVPDDAWYFKTGPNMPFCVAGEANLQPCGWLGIFLGLHAANTGRPVVFANLDGPSGSVSMNLAPESGTCGPRDAHQHLRRSAGGIVASRRKAAERPIRLRFETSVRFFTAEAALAKTAVACR